MTKWLSEKDLSITEIIELRKVKQIHWKKYMKKYIKKIKITIPQLQRYLCLILFFQFCVRMYMCVCVCIYCFQIYLTRLESYNVISCFAFCHVNFAYSSKLFFMYAWHTQQKFWTFRLLTMFNYYKLYCNNIVMIIFVHNFHYLHVKNTKRVIKTWTLLCSLMYIAKLSSKNNLNT